MRTLTLPLMIAGVILFVVSGTGLAQESAEEFKKAVLEKVKGRLDSEREDILKHVAKLLNEDTGGGDVPTDSSQFYAEAIARLATYRENASKVVEEQKKYLKSIEGIAKDDARRILRETLLTATRSAIEEQTKLIETYDKALAKLKSEAPSKATPKVEEPREKMSQEEAADLFEESLHLLQEKQFEASLKGFMRIFRAFTKEDIGYTSAYNVACAYALMGKKEQALEWLERSIKSGFSKFDHIKQDSDLDSLREEPKYKELMKREVN